MTKLSPVQLGQLLPKLNRRQVDLHGTQRCCRTIVIQMYVYQGRVLLWTAKMAGNAHLGILPIPALAHDMFINGFFRFTQCNLCESLWVAIMTTPTELTLIKSEPKTYGRVAA